jgi:hypothetical protein
MTVTKNTLLIIVLVIVGVLFVYFSSGTKMDGMMNQLSWMGGNSFGWFSAVFTFSLGVFIGWLLFKKKN